MRWGSIWLHLHSKSAGKGVSPGIYDLLSNEVLIMEKFIPYEKLSK